MNIFKLGKNKADVCCCGTRRKTAADKNISLHGKIQSIKVLGLGCKACHRLYENTKQAAENTGACEVEYITDMEQISKYGVMSMPALVVNERVVMSGTVLKAKDIAELLLKIGQ